MYQFTFNGRERTETFEGLQCFSLSHPGGPAMYQFFLDKQFTSVVQKYHLRSLYAVVLSIGFPLRSICACFACWCVFAYYVRLFCLLVRLRLLYDL